MTVTLDMLGQPCPIPVIQSKKELAKPEVNTVLAMVDNKMAVENLKKMATGLGYQYSVQEMGSNYAVTLAKTEEGLCVECQPMEEPSVPETTGASTVLITSNQMGRGSEALGKLLIKGFIFSLSQLEQPPKAVLFLNSGVELVVEGSNALADLQVLVDRGTEICACGTCLNFYELAEQLAVGKIVDMYAITQALTSAEKLITL